MDNSFSFLSLLVYSQGSDKVRDIPCPEELVFTVDQKIINEIERTKEMYYEKVGFLALLLTVTEFFTVFVHSLLTVFIPENK